MNLQRLGVLIVPLLAASLPREQPLPVRTGLPAALEAAADSFLAATRDGPDNSGWPDLSDASRTLGYRRVDAVAAMLRGIPAADLETPEARLLHDNLQEAVGASAASRVCRYHLWANTSQFSGWHVAASNAARVQPVGSPPARAAALERFGALPDAMEAERALLRRGLDSGYSAPAAVIEAVIRQLDDLLPADPAGSPLYNPATRDGGAEFRVSWQRLLAGTVYPAARAYRDFLAGEYLPRARRAGSLAALPDGKACYAATLRAQTSVPADPDSLMRAARADLDRVAADLAPLVKTLTGEVAVSDGVRMLRTDPRFTFGARDSILPAYRAMTAKAAARIGRVVAGFHAESLAVEAYPEFQEKAGLPPMYLRASEDRSRPAQFLVNLSRTERMSVADAVAHEAYPGHHLQRIAEVQAQVVHPVMRTLFFGGFIEGWGIYSERLADEMGLYEMPLDRAGLLVHLLDVMVAAYLDVGFHARGWSRADLVDSMMVLGGRTRASAEAYADRHAATPGQLATYYVGYQAIQGYRERAARRLGPAFRSPEFHREVLRDGTITLASLGAKLARWESSQTPSRGTSPERR